MCRGDKAEDSKLARVGLRGTCLYLIFLLGGVPTGLIMGWLSWKSLELNELGDFLAGAFGPLAIFWLVLGFFQQSKELRNNVNALHLQSTELEKAATQQKLLAEANERIANFEDHRWKFQFEVERRKLAIDIETKLRKAESLLPTVKDSRHAYLAAASRLNSGSRMKFDELHENWTRELSRLKEKFKSNDNESAISYSSSTAYFLTEMYRLNSEIDHLIQKLVAELETDRFERTHKVQMDQALRPPPAFGPYGSGSPR